MPPYGRARSGSLPLDWRAGVVRAPFSRPAQPVRPRSQTRRRRAESWESAATIPPDRQADLWRNSITLIFAAMWARFPQWVPPPLTLPQPVLPQSVLPQTALPQPQPVLPQPTLPQPMLHQPLLPQPAVQTASRSGNNDSVVRI